MVINANELWHSLDYLWLSGVARQVVANTHQSYTVSVEVHACGILLFLYLSAQLSALDLIIYLSIISNFSIFLGHPTLHPWVSRREWELSRPFLKTEFRRRFSQPYWPPSLVLRGYMVHWKTSEQWEFNQFTPQTSKFSFIRHANVLVFLGFAETVW